MDGRFGIAFVGLATVAMVFVLGSLSAQEDEPDGESPVALEPVAATGLQRLTLTESAAERLDIQTATVQATPDGTLYVPSAALIITPDGLHWVYTNPAPLQYVRHEITEVVEDDFQASYVSGPALGTSVVIRGVPELYGAEFGIGK